MVRGSLNWIQILPFIQIWPPHPPCMKSSPRMDDYIFLGDRESQAKPLFATIESCVKGRSNLYIYIIYSKYINLHLRSTWKNPATTCSVSPSEGCVHPTNLSLRIQIFPIRKGLAVYSWILAMFRPWKSPNWIGKCLDWGFAIKDFCKFHNGHNFHQWHHEFVTWSSLNWRWPPGTQNREKKYIHCIYIYIYNIHQTI